MKLTFKTTKFRKLLESESKLKQKYGPQLAPIIIQRLYELDSAETMDHLPASLRPHPRKNSKEQIFQIDLQKHDHPTRIFFSPIGDFDIKDLKSIKEIKILSIEKVHS